MIQEWLKNHGGTDGLNSLEQRKEEYHDEEGKEKGVDDWDYGYGEGTDSGWLGKRLDNYPKGKDKGKSKGNAFQ